MEVFIKEVRKVVSLEPNAISIYDDVLVFGATQEEHDQALTLNMKKGRLNLRLVTLAQYILVKESIWSLTKWQHYSHQAHPSSEQKYDLSYSVQELTPILWRALRG